MSEALELEKLVVRLVADSNDYTSTLRAAERDIMSTANVMKAQSTDLAKSLEFQAKTFHMTAREASIYALQLDGATKSQLSAARAADKELTALEKEKGNMSKSNQLMLATVDYTTQLRLQAKTIGMTSREAAIYKLQMAGMSEGSLKAARETDKLLTVLEKEQTALAELKEHNANAVKYTKSLQEQAKTFGMSARSAEIYRQRVAGVDAATIKSMQVANKRLTLLEKEAQLITRGKEVTKQFQSTQTTFNNTMHELDKLLAKNAINLGTYTKAATLAKKELGTGWDRIANAMKPADSAIATVAQRMQGLGRSMSMYVTAPVLGFGALAVREFSSFEGAMTKAFSKMGGIGKDAKADMVNLIKGQSLKSNFDPTQLAGGLDALAAAGMDAKQAIAALPAVDALATAGAFDLDTATRLLMDTQKALNMTSTDANVNLANAVKISDAMVKAGDQSTATVQQMAEAMAGSAEDAARWGMSLEEQTTLLVAYANTGNKGVAAGSDLARSTRLLGQSIRENKDVWERAGIKPIDEATGQYKKFIPLIEEMNEKMKNMTGPQKGDFLSQLKIEALAQSAILPLVGQAATLQETLRGQMAKTGYTAQVAAEQHASFGNQMKEVLHTLKVVGIEIGEQLAPYMRALGAEIKSWLEWWRGLSDETKQYTMVVVAVIAAIGPLVVTFATVGLAVVQLKAGMIALGVAEAGATAGAVALQVALLAIPLAVAAIGLELIGARTAYMELSAATATAIELEKQHQAALAQRSNNIIQKAVKGPNTEEDLKAELKLAEAGLSGLYNNVRTTKKEVDTLAKAWKWPLATSNLTAAKRELKEYEDNLKAGVSHVNALKKAITDREKNGAPVDAATEDAKTGMPQDALDPKRLEAMADVDEMTKKLKEQIATFGMTTEAAKLHALAAKGITKEELKDLTELQQEFNALEDAKKVETKNKQFKEEINDMKAHAAMYGKEAHEIKLYKAELEGVAPELLEEMRAQNEVLNGLDKEKKLRERATALLKKHKTPAKEYEETQKDLKEMLDKGLISLADYNEELVDAEKQMNKEYKVEFKVAGIDAVEAGSAEAMARMMAFQALRPGQVRMPGVDTLNLGGAKGKVNLRNEPKFNDPAEVRARTAANKGKGEAAPAAEATRQNHESRIEALLALIEKNTAAKPSVATINLKPSGIRT